MENINVIVGKTANNFSACVEGLDGFICTAPDFEALKREVTEGVKFHLDGLREDGDQILSIFMGDFQFVFKWDIESLLYYYNGIFTKSALEKLTGINQRQLGHYATGHSKPRRQQIEKIENALRNLGQELIEINL